MELYFDTAATTPLLPEVKDALTAALDTYGNPSSLHHKGVQAEKFLDAARKHVQRVLGRPDGKVVFTGCGTEANNLAIRGVAKRAKARGKHAVTTQIEHPSVLETFRALEREGFEVSYVAPQADGNVAVQDVLSAVREDTFLVSTMHVNNETGAILPVAEIGAELSKRPRTVFHVDGIQAFGKIENCARTANADLYSVSGHKIGAPKGVGALFVRKGLELEPVLYGGGQEFGLRSGTENTLGIAAFGAAAQAATPRQNWPAMQSLMEQLLDGLQSIPDCRVQRPVMASPYIVSVSFPGLKGEVMVHALESQGLFVSTGSACSTHHGQVSDSHVLKAMHKPQVEITGTLRLSLGPRHTKADVDQAIQIVREQTTWLRNLL